MFWLRKCDFRGLFHTERSLLRLNKAFRFFNFLQRRKGERLSWFAFSSWCGTFDRSWLHHWQIDTDGYWISPCWTGFVGLVKSIFATLNQCTCLGYNCSFNELVQPAQVANFPATWVIDLISIDPIRILIGGEGSFQCNNSLVLISQLLISGRAAKRD